MLAWRRSMSQFEIAKNRKACAVIDAGAAFVLSVALSGVARQLAELWPMYCSVPPPRVLEVLVVQHLQLEVLVVLAVLVVLVLVEVLVGCWRCWRCWSCRMCWWCWCVSRVSLGVFGVSLHLFAPLSKSLLLTVRHL